MATMDMHVVLRSFVLLQCVAGAAVDEAVAQEGKTQQFVGSTPADARSREFIGGLPAEALCHCIAWRLTLVTANEADAAGDYTLEVTYGVPGRDDPNQLLDGPTVKVTGKWDVVRGSQVNPQAVVYRIHSAEEGESLLLAQVSKNLLRFLNDDKTLRVGDASWSYTLNRKRAEQEN
jgi:hypothetical protein